MANPLDSLKGLKGWQKAAVAGGGVVTVYVVYEYEKKKKAAAATPATPPTATPGATSGAVSTAGEIQDPATGQYYPDTSVDPDTGLTYQQEITEYGSVSAADSQSNSAYAQGALQGITPQEYVEQTGQYTSAAATAAPAATNAQWMSEVESGLSQQGYTASDIGQGIAAYFAGKPLGTSSDGTSLYTMMNLAVSEYGPPPAGSYPLLNGSGTSSLPGTGTPPAPATATVMVPDITGDDVTNASSACQAAGLLLSPEVPAVKGKVHTVTGQTPPAGAKAAKGSTVKITYKTS